MDPAADLRARGIIPETGSLLNNNDPKFTMGLLSEDSEEMEIALFGEKIKPPPVSILKALPTYASISSKSFMKNDNSMFWVVVTSNVGILKYLSETYSEYNADSNTFPFLKKNKANRKKGDIVKFTKFFIKKQNEDPYFIVDLD